MSTKIKPNACFDPQILGRAAVDAFAKLDPRALAATPSSSSRSRLGVVTLFFLRDLVTGSASPLFSGQSPSGLVHRAVRQLRRSRCGGTGKAQADALQGPQRYAAKRLIDPRRSARSMRASTRSISGGTSYSLRPATSIPSDGEIVEGFARQRVRRHRRIRARHSRGRRRPFGGDRRDDGALRSHQGAHHRGAGSTFMDRMIASLRARNGRRRLTSWRSRSCSQA